MFPGAKTKTFAAQGAHALSETASMLGAITSIAVRHSSQTEKQFLKLQKQLRRFTRLASPQLRLEVITYGESQFWNKPAHSDLDPGIARIVDSYVAKAKAA